MLVSGLALALAAIAQVVPAHAQIFTQTSQTNAAAYAPQGCVIINNGLFLGASDRFMSGGDVARLQNFLIARGHMNYSGATGFFGTITFNAVRNFQAANGISAIGIVGPQTRAKIQALSCGAPIPPVYPPVMPPVIPPTYPINPIGIPSVSFISPSSGPVGTTVTVYGSGFDANTTVSFGGSHGPNLQIINANTLTFRVPERLLPACAYGNIICMIYGPATEPGNYQVSVKNQFGTSNAVNYTVTAGGWNPNPTTGAPVISGIDSPSTLAVGQTGTWTVRASDGIGGNGNLSYRVVWGDEHLHAQGASAQQASANFVQSSSFTHAYAQAGTYNPRFYVRSSNGLTAEVSSSVLVSGHAQTQAPQISYITPSSGGYNVQVTIVGSGFDRYSNSINYAGRSQVAVNVPSYDGTTLVFTVPATPCTYGMMCAQVVMQPGTYPISVTNPRGTSNSVNYVLTGSPSSINQTVSVGIGQTAYVGNSFQIRPIRIVEESRCPATANCVWAGRVVVETQLQSLDMLQNSNLSFGAGSDGMSAATFDGYTVRITGVSPQARSGGISSGEYVITYQVTR